LMDLSYLYWVFNSKRAEFFADPPVDAGPGVDVVVACLAEMRAIARRWGARFHVLAHLHLRGLAVITAPQWADFLNRSGATDITERLRSSGGPDLVAYDGTHWNAAGHRRVAALLKEMLK